MDSKLKITICLFCIVVALLGIIIGFYAKRGNELNNLKNMYADVDLLEEKIAMYYLNNGNLPIANEIDFKNAVNPNDDSLYYEIDLKLLGNTRLAYGNKEFDENDFYIVNNNSHTVYYYKGIKFKDEMHYTRKDIEYDYINLEKYR